MRAYEAASLFFIVEHYRCLHYVLDVTLPLHGAVEGVEEVETAIVAAW